MAQIYLNSYLLGGNRCTVAKPRKKCHKCGEECVYICMRL